MEVVRMVVKIKDAYKENKGTFPLHECVDIVRQKMYSTTTVQFY